MTGAGEARSVVVLDGAGAAALCADDGAGADPVPGDGIWACGATAPGPGRLAVVLDGRRAFGADWPEAIPSGDLTLALGADGLAVQTGRPAAGAAGEPRLARPFFAIDIDRGAKRQAWVLEVSGSGEKTQIACADDGAFPDAARNDQVPTCAGVGLHGAVDLRLRTPSEFKSHRLEVGPDEALLQGRWTASGLQPTDRALLAPPEQPEPPAEQLPPPTPTGGSGPQPTAPRGLATAWWLLGLLAVGGLGWGIGRRGRRRRGLPTGLERVLPEGGLCRRPSWEEAWAAVDLGLPVVLVADEVVAPPGRWRTPVLRAGSRDVLDLLDSLAGLARTDPLRPPAVLVGGPDVLVHPGGLGVGPLEVLEQHLPAGVTCVVVDAAAVP